MSLYILCYYDKITMYNQTCRQEVQDPSACTFLVVFTFLNSLKFEAGLIAALSVECVLSLSLVVQLLLCITMDTLWHYGATFKLNAMNQNKIAFLLDLWDNNSKLAVKIKLNNVFCISTYLWTKLSFVKCYQNN